jgi:hypothetical protein
MDAFRKLQKKNCPDGGSGSGVNPYGCSCCRKHANLNEHKKFSRKRAKRKLKQTDSIELKEFKS